MEKWLSVEHGIMFLTGIAVFSNGMATRQYSFYWFIQNANLPKNITGICKENPTATGCDVYQNEVVAQCVKLTQLVSLRSLVMLCLTWWFGSASDVVGKKRLILANFIGLFVSLVGSGVVIFTEQHPLLLVCTGGLYDLTGGFGILLTVLLASVTSSFGFKKISNIPNY